MGGRKTVYNVDITRAWNGYKDKDGNDIVVCQENKDWVKRFITVCKSNDRSPKTIDQYENWLKVFFSWNCEENGNKPFTEMDATDFMSYVGHLRDLDESPRRIASLKSVLSSLSKMIIRYYRSKYPTFRNEVAELEPVYIEAVREKTVMTTAEVDEILDKLVKCGKYQEACYLALDCACGARKAELIQMKCSWFGDGKDVELCFNNYMYKTPEIRTKGRGKRGKRISKYVIKKMFDKYFTLWMEDRKQKGIDCEYLFITKDSSGQYVQANESTANRFVRSISRVAQKDFYTHAGRHYFCTLLKSMRLPDDVIMQIFGWSSNMVQVYDDTPPEERLENFFKDFAGGEAKGEQSNGSNGTT